MSRRLDCSVAMNFSWVEQDRIAGCRGPRTDKDLAFLASSGIRALVRLAHQDETGISTVDVESHGLEDCYKPVSDWNPPTQTQIAEIVEFIVVRSREESRSLYRVVLATEEPARL